MLFFHKKGKQKKGYIRDGIFLYFGYSFDGSTFYVKRMRIWLRRFEVLGACLFGLFFLYLFIFGLYKNPATTITSITSLDFWFSPKKELQFFFLALIFFAFVLYRHVRILVRPKEIAYENSSFQIKKPETTFELITFPQEKIAGASKRGSLKLRNISVFFHPRAKLILDGMFFFALRFGAKKVDSMHLFYTLLGERGVVNIFARLGVPAKKLQKELQSHLQQSEQKRGQNPILSEELYTTLCRAYEFAVQGRMDVVDYTDLLLALVHDDARIQDTLYTLDITYDKLSHVVSWVRIRERLVRRRKKFASAAVHRNKHGIDKAMTAVATPFLNHFSTDLTLAAMYGHHEPCVSREKEIDEIFRVVEAGRQSIVLVGEHGVGKRSIIEGVVERMIQDVVPERMKDKRLVQISTSALLAGTTVSGAQERLLRMGQEIMRAKNIIVCIHNISELMGGSPDAPGLDVAGTLSDLMRSGNVLVLATSTVGGFNKHVSRSRLASVMTRIDIKEMKSDQAIQVLQAKAGYIEYTHKVFFSYNALAAAVEYAKRFFHDQCLPQSAVEVISEVASYTKNNRGEHVLVGHDDVARVIGEKTGVPVNALTENEADKLLRLEDEMHKRVVGQFEAVNSVANALRRARMQVRSLNRPMANFLFLGSTGVGKTELAKTIAEVYFSGEEQMVRVDMSEYQNTDSIYRLIGQPGKQGTGLLTEAVRQKPFSLVLLDELEKAHPRILDVFLQVFDDGRLTDSVGRVIDFTNTIIIATSNAGTAFIQQAIREKRSMEDVTKRLFSKELKQFFRPEFINRFDGVVVFKPLELDDIKQIASIMIKRVTAELDEKGIKFRVTDDGLFFLAQHGYDPEYGARPMRRAIQDYVENAIAELLLRGEVSRGETIVYDGDHGVYVE